MLIGRYRILGLLGRGGMGAVYKAAMPVTGRVVALKVCKPAEIMEDLMGRDTVERMFLQEAVTMASIGHPNITGIFDVRERDGDKPPHFAMDYYCNNLGVVMGENYEVERPSRLLGVDRSLSIARQMLSGLDRLHYEGIIHRDVKPFNVMLAEHPGCGDEVKLIDFGLSRLRGENPPSHKGMVVGSPYYTAPEQEADPESADARSDCYSVAVTLFRMLVGRLPKEGKIGTKISSLHADLDSRWNIFFSRALADNPDDRFDDALDMMHALDELAEAWVEHKGEICSYFDTDMVERHDTGWRPRRGPGKFTTRQGRAAFGLDELWRPVEYGCGGFEDRGDGTVHDNCTGLVWEQSGSRYPLTWQRAVQHAERMNKKNFGGRNDWRLPTVEELSTLFTGGTEPGRFCIESAFDQARSRLWSADRKAFTAAWYADAELGFIWWQDLTCRFYAKAIAG